jgi:hypothetical protein
MSVLFLLNQGGRTTPTSVPVLPGDDRRATEPVLWVSPLVERLIQLALKDRYDLDGWVEEYARQRGWLP